MKFKVHMLKLCVKLGRAAADPEFYLGCCKLSSLLDFDLQI